MHKLVSSDMLKVLWLPQKNWLPGQKIMNANLGDIFQPLKGINAGQRMDISSHFYMNAKTMFPSSGEFLGGQDFPSVL